MALSAFFIFLVYDSFKLFLHACRDKLTDIMGKGSIITCWIWLPDDAFDIIIRRGFIYLTLQLFTMEDGIIGGRNRKLDETHGDAFNVFIMDDLKELLDRGESVNCRVKVKGRFDDLEVKIISLLKP